MVADKLGRAYTGIDRRSRSERRHGMDRRNLIRYESLGSDRRVATCRREEDGFWLNQRGLENRGF